MRLLNRLNSVATTACQRIAACLLASGFLLQHAFAYDSARLAEALESLTPASYGAWEKRAQAGDAVAQNVVGMAYKYGEVTLQDHAQSFAWFHKAAEQGDADAQFNLGRIYGKATGPVYTRQHAAPRDDVTAAAWYRKAAEQDYTPQFNLAQMYAHGIATTAPDVGAAYFWLQVAAAGGDPNASKALPDIERQLTAADKKRAERLIYAWKQNHPQQGDQSPNR